jgi:polysaccharide pyruvyl transferase WcaK-like protein
MGGYNRKNLFGLSAEYDKLTYRLIDWFIAENDAPVLLVPHVFGTEAESDASVCPRMFAELRHKYPGKIGYAGGTYNQSEIKHLIGKCDFFLGARMHACIAAVSQCVPTVPVAYSDKFIGVMETLGIQDLVVDPRNMTEDEIVRRIGIAYSARERIRRELQSRVPEVKRTALNLFKDFAANGSEMNSRATPVC